MGATLIKIAIYSFVPMLLLFLTSELLGVSDRFLQSDGFVQALGEILRGGTTAKAKLISIAWAIVMAASSMSWRQYVNDQLTPQTIPLPRETSSAAAESLVCSASNLQGRWFAGNAPQGHLIMRITDVRGAKVDYMVVRDRKFTERATGAFDRSNCTLYVDKLGSPARVMSQGDQYRLVAVEPRWTLNQYEAD